MLSSNTFSTRKLLRRGGTLEVSFKRTRKWPLLEKKHTIRIPEESCKLNVKKKKFTLKTVSAIFSSSAPI